MSLNVKYNLSLQPFLSFVLSVAFKNMLYLASRRIRLHLQNGASLCIHIQLYSKCIYTICLGNQINWPLDKQLTMELLT